MIFFVLLFVALFRTQEVSHDQENNLVIDNKDFSSVTKDCLKITNSQSVTIKNSRFKSCFGVGIVIEGCTNVNIENSTFENLNGGVYALDSSDIFIRGNSFMNVARKGKLSGARGQFVQFDKITGGEVSNNVGYNDPAVADPEDLISMYMSKGTASKYLQIFGNCFQGGGASMSGGGIMTGDAGGSFLHVHDNVLIDPGQYGLAVASGNDIIIENNKVFGRKSTVSNVGLYVWNQYPSTCARITARNNRLDWVNKDGQRNPLWDGENCGSITGWSTNVALTNLSSLSCSATATTTTTTKATTTTATTTKATTLTTTTPTTITVTLTTSTTEQPTTTTIATTATATSNNEITTTASTPTTAAAISTQAVGCNGCACRTGDKECDANLECKRTSSYSVCTYVRLYTTVDGDDESCTQTPKLGCKCVDDAYCKRSSFVCSPTLKVCDLPACDKGTIGCACGGSSGDACFDNGICASGTCFPDNRVTDTLVVSSSASSSTLIISSLSVLNIVALISKL